MTQRNTAYQMFKCLLLALSKTRIKTISSLISHLINEALICLLTTFQSDAILAHQHFSMVSDKRVPACRFQSMFPGSGALVWFSCSKGWKWILRKTITVMPCCSNSCCQTFVKLLATFTFQRTTQEHWAAVTQNSGLCTRHVPFQQTRPQFYRLYGWLFRNRWPETASVVIHHQTSSMSCG